LQLAKWISGERAAHAVVVQSQVTTGLREVPDKGCLPGLARANDVDYPAGTKSLFDSSCQMPLNNVRFQLVRKIPY
jgi:hypothetical protein